MPPPVTTATPPFYLNVLLLNKKEVVANKVIDKTGTGLFGKAATALATRVVSDEMVLGQIADVLTEKITQAVQAMGISCEVIKRFQQGVFVCFKIETKSVDQLQLILAVKGEEYAATFSRLLVTLTELQLHETALPKIDEKIANLVHEGMKRKFAELIPLKMKEQGLDVSVEVTDIEQQSEIFFAMLEREKTVSSSSSSS